MEEGVRIPQVGEVIAGKYRLKRLLGEGGMGSVLEAEHLKLRQPIAIKFLNPTLIGVDEIVQRFEREARAAATLRSRHVVRVTDVEVTNEGIPYMVMELLNGADLESERERRKQLPFAEAVDYVLQACGALAEAHDAGIVHRDLKPGNLFLAREDGDRTIVKVLDFGISKFLNGDDVKLTSAGAIMGTALYMSPEQIRGDVSIDARSDIWALGVILFELISGTAPWTGAATRVAAAIVAESTPDLRAVVPNVPEALANAIYRMLEKSAAHRYATIADVASAIAPFAPMGSIGAEIAEHLARRSQRNLAAVAAAAAAAFSQTSLAPTSAPMSGNAGGPDSYPLSGRNHAAVSGVGDTIHVVARANANANAGAGAGANPEQRSTMAATTTSASLKIARPRALWGVLAGLGTLAIAGLVLIVFVTRAKSHNTGGARAGASADPVTPPSFVQATSEPVPSATPPPPPPTAMTAMASATAPSAATGAVAVKRPVPGVAVPRTTATTMTTTTAATPARPTAPPKASETTPPAFNPPFLK